jgi:hypothetical protein
MAARSRPLLAHERVLAELIAERVVDLIRSRGSVASTGTSSRAGEEESWRDGEKQESTDPMNMDSDGESTWLMNEAKQLVARSLRKRRLRE